MSDEPEAALWSRLSDLDDALGDDDALELVVVRTGHDVLTTYEVDLTRRRARIVHTPTCAVAEARRLGELLASALPRIYVGGAVHLGAGTVRALLSYLDTPEVRVARPPIRYAASHSARRVRRYYQARMRLRRAGTMAWGEGVFGLSAAARARLGPFPLHGRDDVVLAARFTPAEMAVLDTPPATVRAPHHTVDLAAQLRGACSVARAPEPVAPRLPSTTWRTALDVFALALTRPRCALDAFTYASLAFSAHTSAA